MIQVKLCDIPIELNTHIPAIHSDWDDIFVLQQHKTDAQPRIIIDAFLLDQAPPADQSRTITHFESPNGRYSLASTTNGRSMLTLASKAIICLPDEVEPGR